MSNWNNAAYAGDPENPGLFTSPNSAFDSPHRSAYGDDCTKEWQAMGYSDPRPSITYSQANTWPVDIDRAVSTRDSQSDLESPQSFPFGSSSLAPFVQGYFPAAKPANLQHYPEVPQSPAEEEAEDDIAVKIQEEERVIAEVPPKRKRGRPKLQRTESSPNSSKNKTSQRVPHNQVERKYREMLNAEMERLRVNVPTLPQHDMSSLAGAPKPSKATVLAAAVDYIKHLESEMERLGEENEYIKERMC